ncbi:hypothetical protein LPB136_11570 [Tenacibaculum todarodis]|uniref:Uncharacterized protein n=1 Tax=Tenacibaculum todarodis TaxID=1850252 RepID=A0A1L3JLI9_9FLAO|nr:DUF5687 family protein [Tenacibaculum todarodis]APG65962.1 hypothetical protein LPB136_11570 [Tenacibaculum todarodis]
MISHFLNLEWKQFFRSASFGKNVGIKILMAFFAIIILVNFLFLGAKGYSILEELFPGKDPFVLVNQFMIFMVISDLIFRYLMQKIPVMDIKPMLALPIKKNKLVNYVLTKSVFSFFNFGSLVLYIPFAIVLIMEGYNVAGVVGWTFFMIMLAICLNFTNFLINKNNIALGVLVALLGGLWLAFKYELGNVTGFFGDLFYAVYQNPLLSIIGVIFAGILYYLNFKQLSNVIYLDGAVKTENQEVNTSDLSFVDRLGSVAPFIKNDMRLIWRNKRTKTVFLMSFFFLLFGLMFFTMESYKDMEVMQLYGAIFVTAGFSMNYGQFVPAWDSEHYRMLMTQNLSYRKFLESKWYLMIVMTVILFVLCTPYLYFGIHKYLLIVAGFFFNLGFTPLIMLYMGAFNKKRIELSSGGLANTQGTSAAQFLVMIPVLVLPIIVYAIVNHFLGFNAAIIAIALIGVVSLLLKNPIMSFIEKKYQEKKYATIHGFKQQD